MSTLFHMKLGDGSALFLISSRKRTTSESLLEARFQQIYSAGWSFPHREIRGNIGCRVLTGSRRVAVPIKGAKVF
jgi:hypothetical protein